MPLSSDFSPLPLHEAFERRMTARVRRRLQCTLEAAGVEYPGAIVDSGAEGLYVETEGDLRPGARVTVVVRNGAADLRERGAVVYRRQVPQSLAAISASGVGVRLDRHSALHRLLLAAQRRAARR